MNSAKATVLPILEWPHPILRKIASPVNHFDADLVEQVERMWATMYDAPGVGLAAPQVGDSRRIFIMDCGGRVSDHQRLVCVNPELYDFVGEIESTEGCLSFPKLSVTIPRAERVTLRAQNEHGVWFELSLKGLEAVCAQHELDHLDGKSFLDGLSQIERLDSLQSYLELLQDSEELRSDEMISTVKVLIDETLKVLITGGDVDE